jgi:hypothetical protein
LRDRVEKLISHLGGLETKTLAERMREGAPTEEEDPGESPCSPRILGHRREEFGEEEPPASKTWRETKGFEKKAMVQRFKYPWTHAWPDIVWASWTLSG